MSCALCGGGDTQAPVELEFSGGERLLSDLNRVSELVSELIAHLSRLVSLRPAEERAFYRRHKKDDHTWLEELKATFAREPGEPLPEILDNLPPAAQENVALLGTFFLVSPFHILTTASLAHMKALHSVSDWHIERFRPNVSAAFKKWCNRGGLKVAYSYHFLALILN